MQPNIDYRNALAYLYSLTDYEKKGFAAYAPENYNLDRTNRLLSLLDRPQKRFRAVHIAGTKGKGSTAALIESVLRASGCRAALYTSPHLHTFRERIQVAGSMISEADVVRLIGVIRPLVDQVPEITTFEVMTGLAFAWFAEQEADWAVLEVGLGGRLDATNVVTPEVSVITSISRDHTAVLGDTLAEIAGEKAGIIKPGIPVVSAPQEPEALSVIRTVCEGNDAPLTLVGDDWRWEPLDSTGLGQAFNLYHGQRAMSGLRIPLLGDVQLENAAVAVATLWEVRHAGLDLSEEVVRDGLWAVDWPGRLEVLSRAPLVIADSAHNGDSARKLMEALETNFEYERLIVVLGSSGDHLTPALLAGLLAGADRAIGTCAQHPRAARPELIQSRAAEMGFSVGLSRSVPHALDLALSDAGSGDLICCTGSVFVAAEARQEMVTRQGRPAYPSDPS
ncbi:bifunctional folylpolyglutamate synthase/dihydrofolate synthase [Chloroflexota bacterium]